MWPRSRSCLPPGFELRIICADALDAKTAPLACPLQCVLTNLWLSVQKVACSMMCPSGIRLAASNTAAPRQPTQHLPGENSRCAHLSLLLPCVYMSQTLRAPRWYGKLSFLAGNPEEWGVGLYASVHSHGLHH